MICESYIACSKCVGNLGNQFEIDVPEMCQCEGTTDQGGKIRVTAWWLKCLRRARWEEKMKWDYRDMDRTINSEEALPS